MTLKRLFRLLLAAVLVVAIAVPAGLVFAEGDEGAQRHRLQSVVEAEKKEGTKKSSRSEPQNVQAKAPTEVDPDAEEIASEQTSSSTIYIVPNSASKQPGDVDPMLTAMVLGADGADVQYVLYRAEGEEIGQYPIFVTVVSAPSGYNVVAQQGVFTIGDAEDSLSISSGSTHLTYNGKPQSYAEYRVVYNGAELKPDESGLVYALPTGDTLTISKATTLTHVNESAAANNTFSYTLSNKELEAKVHVAYGTITIDPVPLTITARNQDFLLVEPGSTVGENLTTYNDPEVIEKKIIVEGLQNGDTVTKVTLDGLASFHGSYELRVIDAEVSAPDGDYEIELLPGKLNVVTEIPDIRISSLSTSDLSDAEQAGWVYDGKAHSLKRAIVTYGGETLAGNDNTYVLPTGDTLTLTGFAAITNAGTKENTFTYTVTNPDFYEGHISVDTGILTLRKANLNVSANRVKEYNGSYQGPSADMSIEELREWVTLNGIGEGDQLSAANVTMAEEGGVQAGTYALQVSNIRISRDGEDATDNYDITVSDGVLTILPRPVTLTLSSTISLFYGENDTVKASDYASNITISSNGEALEDALTAEVLGNTTLTPAYPNGYTVGTFGAIGSCANFDITVDGSIQILDDTGLRIGGIDSRDASITLSRENVKLPITYSVSVALPEGKYCVDSAKSYDNVTVETGASISVGSYHYSASGQSWEAGLPAGTVITVTPIVEGESLKSATQTVAQSSASLAASIEKPFIGQSLTLDVEVNVQSKQAEVVKIELVEGSISKTFYETVGNSKTVHLTNLGDFPDGEDIKATVSLLDSNVNLIDVAAVTISGISKYTGSFGGTVSFENRGDVATITLEQDAVEITSVTIDGFSSETSEPSGSGKNWTYALENWKNNPTNLPPKSSTATVKYVDKYGNEGTATGTSTMSTGKSITITYAQPTMVRENGRLVGMELRLSGQGTAYEKMTLNVNGRSYPVQISGSRGTYDLEARGQWSKDVSLDDIDLAGDSVRISAKYDNINGSGSADPITYRKLYQPTLAGSPELMRYDMVYGFADPDATIIIEVTREVDGQTQVTRYDSETNKDMFQTGITGGTKYYVFELPERFQPGDRVDVWYRDANGVEDLASKYTLIIPEEVYGQTMAEALGANIIDWSASEGQSAEHHFVVPVKVDELTAAEDHSMTVPILAFDGYAVGHLTLTLDGSELKTTCDLDPECVYDGAGYILRYYDTKPTIAQLAADTSMNDMNVPIDVTPYGNTLWVYAGFEVEVDPSRVVSMNDFVALYAEKNEESKVNIDPMDPELYALYMQFQQVEDD